MERIKTKFNVVENTIYLYGPVMDNRPYWVDDEKVDYIALNEVKRKLDEMTGDITIRLNSYGGSAYAGIAIHNLIKDRKGKTTVKIDGIAASAASLIALASDKLIMPKSAQIMTHGALSALCGYFTKADLESELEQLNKLNESISEILAEKVGEEKAKELLEKDTFLTAKEAYEMGLCDEVVGVEEEEENKSDDQILNNIYNRISKIENTLSHYAKTSAANEETNLLAKFRK